MRNTVLAGICCLLLASLTSGCLDNKCDQIDEEPVRYTDGHTNPGRTFYQTSAPGEPLVRFPAARTLRLEHGLRDAPVDVSVFLSFDSTGDQSLAAGDQALLSFTPEYIGVRNNTCADFFVRVTAWALSPEIPFGDAVTEVGDADVAPAPTTEVTRPMTEEPDGSVN